MVFGFLWFASSLTYYLALSAYPANFQYLHAMVRSPLNTFLITGCVYGLDLMLFYNAFVMMYEKLRLVYVQNSPFSTFFFVIRVALYYLVLISFCMAAIITIYPFTGPSGGVFGIFTKQAFLDPCEKYWFSNIFFI